MLDRSPFQTHPPGSSQRGLCDALPFNQRLVRVANLLRAFGRRQLLMKRNRNVKQYKKEKEKTKKKNACICNQFDLCRSASGCVYYTRRSARAPLFTHLSVERVWESIPLAE